MIKEFCCFSIVMLFMFFVLFVVISWIQVVEVDSLVQNIYNKCIWFDSYEIQCGLIIVDGVVIVNLVFSDDQYQFQCVYVDVLMWEFVMGYFNLVFDFCIGIEKVMNVDLFGIGVNVFFGEVECIFFGQFQCGFSVEFLFDIVVQKVVYEVFGGLQGVVVVMDFKIGCILVMVLMFGFDMNIMVIYDVDVVNVIYDQFVVDLGKLLLNCVIVGDFNFFGFMFKVVVVVVVYVIGDWNLQFMLLNFVLYMFLGLLNCVFNVWGGICGFSEIVMIVEVICFSCNILMVELVVVFGDDMICEMVEKMGFNKFFEIFFILMLLSYLCVFDDVQIVLMGFGQGQVIVMLLQMVMVLVGFVNDGVVMNFCMVDVVIGNDLVVIKVFENSEFGCVMELDVVNDVIVVMVVSVVMGVVQGVRIDGIDVVGKMGIVENGNRLYMLWFIGFVLVNDFVVVVVVVVEDGGGQG